MENSNWSASEYARYDTQNLTVSLEVLRWFRRIYRKCNYFHIVSGDGYLAIIEMIPKYSPCHLYLHEPHRGLHEDSYRNLNGKLKRPKIITDLLLRKSRNKDLTIVREFYNRKHTTITGNSNYSSSRADEVYGIKTEMLSVHRCQ